ncbi:MAG: ornithine carbamoyltransferase [Kiritimatiellae bacterium]|nr:ornithine carbamoyltransferase [Kiritimatiellia bacterium]MDD4341811.1 ornithine carbamoyltransferase [Kiritimatiellia bacterium]
MRHLLTLEDWSQEQMAEAVTTARAIKAEPHKVADVLRRKTLAMVFEKPSLRTRLSFEAGMNQMGGHAIYYDTSTSPFGAGKETIADTVRTMCRYVDIIMARLFKHEDILEMARHATVPVINALTNFSHPGQILADLQTIEEHKGHLAGLKLAYFGDSFNNVTHSLLFACPKMGLHLSIACPSGNAYKPDPRALAAAQTHAAHHQVQLDVTQDAATAAREADVVYTDSWMSYHIPKEQAGERMTLFAPYRVTGELMALAKSDAIFLNCLPAQRGMEQTAKVIDGPQSVVFDQAENRMHMHKALLYLLLKEAGSLQE